MIGKRRQKQELLWLFTAAASATLVLSGSPTAKASFYGSTTTRLTSTINPSNVGQTATFSAVVTSNIGTPTGVVAFKLDSVVKANVTLINGVANYSTSSVASGTHTIVASYLGDGDFLPSDSNSISQGVGTQIQGVVDSSSINHKFMFGFQGWFRCPTDGNPTATGGLGWPWWQWFGAAPPTNSNVLVDNWPDTSELPPSEKCDTGLKLPNGQPAYVFSDYNAATVARQFTWMKQNDLDGVWLQRFTKGFPGGATYWSADYAAINQVDSNVISAAQQSGRVFGITYDISSDSDTNLVARIENDWKYQVDTLHATASDRYIRQARYGTSTPLPVVELWGFGFKDRLGTTTDLQNLLNWFHDPTNPYRATVMGGVTTDWATNATWASVYRGFDIISPWTNQGLNGPNAQPIVANDLNYCNTYHLMYMPSIWPGFSALHRGEGQLNQVPRNGGNTYWTQSYNEISQFNLSTYSGVVKGLYGAMFDEANEGTGIFKVVPTSAGWPNGMVLNPLDADGYHQLPSDWYMLVADYIGMTLKGQRAPTAGMPIQPY